MQNKSGAESYIYIEAAAKQQSSKAAKQQSSRQQSSRVADSRAGDRGRLEMQSDMKARAAKTKHSKAEEAILAISLESTFRKGLQIKRRRSPMSASLPGVNGGHRRRGRGQLRSFGARILNVALLVPKIDRKSRRGQGKRRHLPSQSLLSLYLNQVNRFPLLSPEKEAEVARRARKGDRAAYELLVNSNLRFVVRVAKRYCFDEAKLMDVINEGNMGLMRAANKFDPDKGCHFISYAIWNIKQSVLSAVNEQSSLIHLPMYQMSRARKAGLSPCSGAEELDRCGLDSGALQEHGLADGTAALPSPIPAAPSTPKRKQIASECLLQMSQAQVSLDAFPEHPSSGDIVDPNIPDPYDAMVERQLRETVESTLSELSLIEQEVIVAHYGLREEPPASMSEVGTRVGLSKEQACKIERKAIRKIRNSKSGKLLAGYLYDSWKS